MIPPRPITIDYTFGIVPKCLQHTICSYTTTNLTVIHRFFQKKNLFFYHIKTKATSLHYDKLHLLEENDNDHHDDNVNNEVSSNTTMLVILMNQNENNKISSFLFFPCLSVSPPHSYQNLICFLSLVLKASIQISQKQDLNFSCVTFQNSTNLNKAIFILTTTRSQFITN